MKLAVAGMTCRGGAAAVTNSTQRLAPGEAVKVDLAAGAVEISDNLDEAAARQAIERAGFRARGRIA